jgi:CRP/FNR family transcriptional regulator, cyclic AMP receptor protein
MQYAIEQLIEHFRERYHVELFGFAAAAASLYAFYVRTIIPLRIAAIVANVLAMIYSVSKGTYPTFLLNAILLPLNFIRLQAMRNLVHEVDTAMQGDLNVEWLRPYMRPKAFSAGDFLIQQGEFATEAFYLVTGEVEVVENQKTYGPGTLIGEIGLFTPGNRRTMSVRCKTEVHSAIITYDQFKQLYFQNPQFGFAVLRLIVARLHASPDESRPAQLS